MPAATNTPRLDAWPPFQVRLSPTIADDDVSPCDIDSDPLSYFLTPAPDVDDDEPMPDFDAGIEDSNHPREIIRSVSPSSLGGLRWPEPRSRSLSPELDSEVETPDEDDDDDDEDDEDYVRFAPSSYNLSDLTIDGVKTKLELVGRGRLTASFPPPRPSSGAKADALLSPSSFHVGGPSRGRAPLPSQGRGRSRSASSRRRVQRLWREPSPDVWSIEEEPEEEMRSETGSVARGDVDKKQALDGTAAKPIKRVRFVLPGAA